MAETPVQRFYRLQAGIYDLTRWTILYGRRRAVDALDLQPSDSVLEIGCGTGLNLPLIQRRLDPRRGNITGVDFSPQMLARARPRVRRRRWSNVRLLQADAAALSLPDRFDAALFSYSLSTMPDWRASLHRSIEHLKPGGRLVVLDFGSMTGLGTAGRLLHAWLRFNHVDADQPYLDELSALFPDLHVRRGRGDYNFIAIGRRPG